MGRTTLNLVNDRKSVRGQLTFEYFKLDMRPSLIKYLKEGWNINASLAIDFTLSNNPIDFIDSLHRQDPENEWEMNIYERAIFEVCGVLESYTKEKQFICYGFGGAPKYLKDNRLNGKISHCWNLTGYEPEPKKGEKQIKSGQKVLGLYHHAIKNTELAGPTYFSFLLKRFMQNV